MIINDPDDNFSDVQLNNEGNPALADAMKKVLNIGKNAKKQSIVLAKAKIISASDSHSQLPKKNNNFQVEVVRSNGQSLPPQESEVLDNVDSKEIKPDKSLIKRKRKFDGTKIGRQKPSPLDREKERPLVKIATRGVVQLFNAVREQHRIIETKLDEAGPSETKKEKALKSINKKSFLDVLRGCATPINSSKKKISSDIENEVKTEDENEEKDAESRWSVLRDDFMMGAKLKDWGKDDGEDNQAESKVIKAKRPRKAK